MDLKVNIMTLDDLNSIRDILISDFDNFWNYNIFKEELKCDNSYFIVAKDNDNKIVGFAGFKVIIDEADIMNIVVKKDCRNKGFGSFLLNTLISYANDINISIINLEVNEKNLPAISLYERFGFEKLGIRKKYYKGIDDAIIMKKILK